MINYRFIKRKHFGLKKKFRFLGLDDVTQTGDIWIRVEDLDGETMVCRRDLEDMSLIEVSSINQRRDKAIQIIMDNHARLTFYPVTLGGQKTSTCYNRIYLRAM